MKITWNAVKAKSNKLKHRVSFADVEPVFSDPNAISIEDPDALGEERFVSIGVDALGRVLAVVYTYRDLTIRLISARHANKPERKQYEKRIRLQ